MLKKFCSCKLGLDVVKVVPEILYIAMIDSLRQLKSSRTETSWQRQKNLRDILVTCVRNTILRCLKECTYFTFRIGSKITKNVKDNFSDIICKGKVNDIIASIYKRKMNDNIAPPWCSPAL